MLDLKALFWLFLLVVCVYYLHRAFKAKGYAYTAAQRHCQEMEVQLLDQSVYLRRIWIKRNDRGQLCLWRAFYFDFTVRGDDRYQGRVLVMGSKVTAVQLEPHRVN